MIINNTKEELDLIEKEIKGCFDYFWNESNGFTSNEKAYGLTLDKTPSLTKLASIAATGFALASYVIGVEHQFITFEEGYDRVLKTLKMALMLPHKEGFLVHFVNQDTGESNGSEYSTIDTAIFLCGAITASQYFKKQTLELTDILVNRCNWEWLVKDNNSKKQIIMAYSDKYWVDNNGFCKACWDHYAEQLMIYLLYAGKDNCDEQLAKDLYLGFDRTMGSYQGIELIHCYSNPLFIHQFSHCFFDFRDYIDCEGINWFENSIKATICNQAYCTEQTWSKTYSHNSWGLTAFQGEHGYKVFGAPPFGFIDKPYHQELDGSVAPYASLSSMVFTPVESMEALKYFNTIPNLDSIYGLKDSYNFENSHFVSSVYLGIDKGPTIIMLDNYIRETVWKYFMESKYCLKAIEVLGFTHS